MIAKIAVEAASFAIDKPYSYRVPEGMALQPGHRVRVNFGRGSRITEGVVLAIEDGDETGLKAVEAPLEETPLLTVLQLRLAAFLRERYFCTFYDAVRLMLPAGAWFRVRSTFSLTDDRSWKERKPRKAGAEEVLLRLEELGGTADAPALRQVIPDEEQLGSLLSYLLQKKWVSGEKEYIRRTGDKTERVASLAVSTEEAMEFAASRPKSAAMQKSVLELLCGVGSAAVKDILYYTGASAATVNRLEKLGYLTMSQRAVLRCSEIKPVRLDGPLVLSAGKLA